MLVGGAASARAQVFVSPFIGYDFGGDAKCPAITNCEDKYINAGASIGLMGALVGWEEEFGYAKEFFGDAPGLSSSMLTLMSNIMIVPDLGPVRPYALAGVGLMKTHVEFKSSSVFSSTDNHFGWDVGGGVMALFSEHVGVRGDLRYFHAFDDFELLGLTFGDTKLDFGRVSGAAVFTF
jgi:opacity protein-like surface antigen